MRRHSLGLIALIGVLGVASLAHTLQRPGESAAPTGLLMGVVVDALDDRPVPHSEVTLGGAPPTTQNTRVLTDAEGRFVFMDLPAATYTLTATKNGYAEGALGRRRPLGPSQSVTLAAAQRVGDLTIPVWKFAAISGRVTDEVGEPMVGIAVRVLARTIVAGKQKLTPGATVRTDDRGEYRIASLTPGAYAVVVPATQTSAPQSVVDLFIQGRRGPRNPGDPDISRDLSYNGAIEAFYQFERNTGSRIGTSAFISSGDRSRAGVAPMPSGDGRMYVYPTVYHPAMSAAADASLVTVQSGEERLGVDVQVALVGTSRVSGIVLGPEGPTMAALSLVPDSDDLSTDSTLEVATTVSDASGRFTFFGVPEGRHRLRAFWASVPVGGGGSRGAPPPRPAGGGAPPTPPRPALGGFTLWATQTIEVGESDIADLPVTLSPGHRIGGRAAFVGDRAQPSSDELRRMSATFDPADARPLVSPVIGRGQFDDEGYLSSYQLPPGRYYVRINGAPPGWTLKSATYNGRDISNVALMLDRDVSGLVVTFTDRPSTLSGQVNNPTGAPDVAATVLVFPADAAAWSDYGGLPRRLRAVRVGLDGHYSTVGLPPGDYLVVAVADEASANWQDPAVLRALARVATSVTLADGESRTVALGTVGVPR